MSALMLESRGKYKKVEAMDKQTLGLKLMVPGRKYPDTLTSAHLFAKRHRYGAYFVPHE
jgi:hypothetical protein